MTENREYILGTDRVELQRMHFQHAAWRRWAYALWERAGIGAGDAVLDLGCGPGATTFDLAGVVALQEYLDWAATKLVPRSQIHERIIESCKESWRLGGGEIDVGAVLPVLAPAAGLEVVSLQPIARVGRAGSLEWRWLGGFFASYLPRLVERGLLDAGEHEEFRAEWTRRSEAREGWCVTPTMVDVLLRRPLQG